MCNKEGGKLINTQHLCISNFAQSYSNKKMDSKDTRHTDAGKKLTRSRFKMVAICVSLANLSRTVQVVTDDK